MEITQHLVGLCGAWRSGFLEHDTPGGRGPWGPWVLAWHGTGLDTRNFNEVNMFS